MQMPHPGERMRVGVKAVPHSCIADPELRLIQYTAIDEFTRLRFLAAYLEQFTYSSCRAFYSLDDFAKQLSVHNRRSSSLPMRPLRWRSPIEHAVQCV